MTDERRRQGTSVDHPGHMQQGRKKQNRLNGTCPDYKLCSLQIACSEFCWRLEGHLIEAGRKARVAAAVPFSVRRAGRTT